MKPAPRPPSPEPLRLLSVVIPMRDESGAISSTVEHLHLELRLHNIEHEIVTVDDGSTDSTWAVLQELASRAPSLRPAQNTGEHGFGRAVTCGIDHSRGDAVRQKSPKVPPSRRDRRPAVAKPRIR